MLMGIDDGAGAAGGATGPTAADISAAATKAANEAVNARAEADKRANVTAAAEAERAAAEAATKTQLDATRAQLASAQARLRDGAIAGQLAGIKDPQFVALAAADLGDVVDGALSPDQIARLVNLRNLRIWNSTSCWISVTNAWLRGYMAQANMNSCHTSNPSRSHAS